MRLDDGPGAGRPFGGAIVCSVWLRVSFDVIAANGALDASVEDDAERWCAMEVAGRG